MLGVVVVAIGWPMWNRCVCNYELLVPSPSVLLALHQVSAEKERK